MLILFLLLELVALNDHSPASAAVANIQVMQCPKDLTEAPNVAIAPASTYPKLAFQSVNAVVRQEGSGYFVLSFEVASGNYFISVKSSHCFEQIQASLLGGHERALSMALFQKNPKAISQGHVVTFSLENAVAGAMDVRPDVAWIVADDGRKRVLDIQDGAYYIERVTPGKYSVRMEFHSGVQSEVPLDLSQLSSAGYEVRAITVADIRKHLGTVLATGKTWEECYWCL